MIRLVETMAVVDLVDLVHLVRDVVVESVSVHPIVPGDNAGMMDAGGTHVELVHQPNHVQMVCVWGLPRLIVETDNAEITEQEEAVETARPDNDVVEALVNVTMTAMTEIVELLHRKWEQTLDYVPKDHAEHVPLVIPVAVVADVKSCLPALSL